LNREQRAALNEELNRFQQQLQLVEDDEELLDLDMERK